MCRDLDPTRNEKKEPKPEPAQDPNVRDVQERLQRALGLKVTIEDTRARQSDHRIRAAGRFRQPDGKIRRGLAQSNLLIQCPLCSLDRFEKERAASLRKFPVSRWWPRIAL